MSLPFYSTKCNYCEYENVFSFDTNYQFENLYDDEHRPSLKVAWCEDCDSLVISANPQTEESISEEVQKLSAWIMEEQSKNKRKIFGLFAKKADESLIQKWKAEITHLKEAVNFYEFREMQPKCLTCGSTHIVRNYDVQEVETANVDIGIQHHCGGKILVSYGGRIAFDTDQLPIVKYDLDGTILADARTTPKAKNRSTETASEKLQNIAKRALVKSIVEKGLYSGFLIFIEETDLDILREKEIHNVLSVFVEVIEDRIAADDFDDVLNHHFHSNHGILPAQNDNGKSIAKRVVVGPNNTPVFQW